MIGVLNSAVSLYYYIRIVVFMYLKNETDRVRAGAVAARSASTLAWRSRRRCVLGVYPTLLFDVGGCLGADARGLRRGGWRA